MGRVLKREAAKRDLAEQWLWYAEKDGIDLADRFLEAADATLASLANHPLSGSRVRVTAAEIRGMRRFPIGEAFERILLFYLPLSDGVDLVRVVHGSRNLDRLFSEQCRDIPPPPQLY